MDLLIVVLITICISSYRIYKFGSSDPVVSVTKESGESILVNAADIQVGKNLFAKVEHHAFERILEEFNL